MTKRPSETSSFSDAAPMEQVRELLFGAQLKEMDIRLQRQEERFQRDIGDSREALKKRIDSLENFMKSEVATLLHRIKEEQDERESSLKDEQRERAESARAEQRERTEALKIEQRERSDALAQLAKDLSAATETLERKITKVSSTLDNAERELRQLMQTETHSLTEKIEEKYQDALDVIANTAAQIRHDMVHRSSLSSMFTEVAVKLSGQWSPEVGHMIMSGGETAQAKAKPSAKADAEQEKAEDAGTNG